ncbi:MAG TPA: methyltransferase [Bacteroidales bacterium]|jgi:tRNA1Val (adenine37-N6)-methyltransferase|nr:methyltransferase [Bacteroidales bacterium]OQB59699.1 MAG: tRNA1(Val) (adenine(37)-N6)-methyltransferase [Bacteroidetes bacterium ADurb.Bin145]HOU02323.1 methyltransferase [Bacteroidales bacterium]HQG63418.1 methyltransferase [Bacteroidales bacterium]HQK68328.1 methyltransferase [Bacteroidales bacterium]
MSNSYFSFKQFTIRQDRCAFKVGTDGVLLGASADTGGAQKILDIGTGTGLIALMLAQRCQAEITAIEPDKDSFGQACENVRNSKWQKRINIHNSSLQDFNPGNLKYDLIVSNPPYFRDSLKNPDPAKAASRHNINLSENELLKGVSRLLEDTGKLQVIMPYAEGNIFIAEASDFGLFCIKIIKIKSLPTSDIRRLILTFSRTRQEAVKQFLTIEHGRRHEFTDEYKNLTKDFYLKF